MIQDNQVVTGTPAWQIRVGFPRRIVQVVLLEISYKGRAAKIRTVESERVGYAAYEELFLSAADAAMAIQRDLENEVRSKRQELDRAVADLKSWHQTMQEKNNFLSPGESLCS